MNRLLTIEEVATLTRLSKATLYAYVSRRVIPHVKLGTRTMFTEQEVEHWIRKRAVASVANPTTKKEGNEGE